MRNADKTRSASRWLPAAGILALLCCLAFSGCVGTPSGIYYNMCNWYVRENATPRYAAEFDVFFMYPDLFAGDEVPIENVQYARQCTTELFDSKARVFAPICRNYDDCRAAFEWYIKYYHGKAGRPFVFIGEGQGARMLELLAKDAKEYGLVSMKLNTALDARNTVTPELVEEVCKEVKSFIFELSWRKERHAE